MKRIDKANLMYSNGVVIPKSEYTMSDTLIHDCCPYFLDCGEDDLDEASRVGEFGSIKGCRGITCEQCWDKEYVKL